MQIQVQYISGKVKNWKDSVDCYENFNNFDQFDIDGKLSRNEALIEF